MAAFTRDPIIRPTGGLWFILVLCDYATWYLEAITLRNVDANTIAEELVKFFSRVGVPEEILTDQGTNFTSQLLAEVYRLLRIKLIRTTPYHPQTDGLVERFNHTLKQMLKKTHKQGRKRLGPHTTIPSLCIPRGSAGLHGIFPIRATLWSPRPRTSGHSKGVVGSQRQKFGECGVIRTLYARATNEA